MIEASQTEICFSCKGKGKVTVTAQYVGSGPWGDSRTESHDIPCLICKGAKTTPRGSARKWKRDSERFWCGCAEPGEPVFHDDGECRQCDKHHYHCSKCGKIRQVG